MSAQDDKPPQRRRYFRLPYPASAQPPLHIHDGKTYRVMEIAENSLVIELAGDDVFSPGTKLSGELVLHNDEREVVEGEVYRLDKRGAVVLLSKGINLQRIAKEQAFIQRARFIAAEGENTDQRRRYFRLPYPSSASPPFKIGDGRSYKVLEIAENSMVIAPAKGEAFQPGDSISGLILFHDQASELVEGSIYRLDERGAVILLSKGISLRHVASEQAYIKTEFPLFLRHKR